MTKPIKQTMEPVLTLAAISDLLDQKLEEKLEQKLEQKLDQKLDEKLKPLSLKLDQTIEDVAGLKQDLEIVKNYLATEVPTRDEVNKLVEGLATKADVQAIMDRLDQDVVRDQKFDQEQTMHSHRLREHTDQLNTHSAEIKALQLATT